MLKKFVPDSEFIVTAKPPKEWQLEAFFSAVLFCCQGSFVVSIGSRLSYYDWDFKRICWLMNTYGNVFDFPFSDRCRTNVSKGRTMSREMSKFVNNLRLTHTDAKVQLFEICSDLLSINQSKDDDEIRKILRKELME